MLLPGSETVIYWATTIGIPMTIKGVAYLYTAIGGTLSFLSMQAYDKNKENKETKLVNEVREQKQLLEAKNFNKEHEEEKIKVNKEYEKVDIERKNAAIEAYELAELRAEKIKYKGIKPERLNQLLLGYTADLNPYWGIFTNYIVAGETGARKSRKLQTMLLNFLANKQGTVYIGDFKQIDFKAFKDKKGVAMYVDDIEDSKKLVEAFKKEFQRRLDIIKAGYTDAVTGEVKEYIDIDDYNEKNSKAIIKPYVLLIDEYADLSDTYKGKQGQPIGPYQQIIELARKIRATGGRIILGTQRPSADVIIGTLKNNTRILSMRCLNEINSKICIDQAGSEKLEPGEALTIDSKLIKIWNYDLDNKHLESCIAKLK